MEIKEKLILEQDLISFYAVKSSNKSIGIIEEYSKNPSITYSGIKRYITKDIELLKSFSTENLIKLLTAVSSKDTAMNDALVKIIMERLKTEKFFCEDIDNEFFMKPVHSNNIMWSKLGKENLEKIKTEIIKRLKNTKGTSVENIANNLKFVEDAANFLKYFEDGIFTEEKIATLEEMISKDENALRYMNFGLFQDKIYNIGTDFVKYISKFPALSAQLIILEKHNPELLKVLENEIKSYKNLPDNYDKIEVLMTYFTKKSFAINLDKATQIDENNLIDCAFLNFKTQSDPDVINVEYGENYNERLKAEYDKKYNEAENISQKLNVYFNKRFSMSIGEAKKIIEEYASDLENLNISEEDRKLFSEIENILKINKETDIDEIYNECITEYKAVEIMNIKQKIASECALSYTESMEQTDKSFRKMLKDDDLSETIDYNGIKVKQVKLRGNFDLLVHSTDTGFISEQKIDKETNFVKKWAIGKDKSNHIISTSYINQDFLGCAPVNENGVMYGFTKINREDIKLMGVTDINTYSREFSYSSKYQKYMSAKTMPYNSRRVYNEFALEREKVTPDYVILFDDMNEKVKENAYRAATQFEIPVLYIDKEEIVKQQMENLQNLIENFKQSGDVEILKHILNTYETNSAGWLLNRGSEEDKSYTGEIDNSHFKHTFEEMWKNIDNTISEYINTATNNKDTQDLVKIGMILLSEMELYKDCSEVRPISKTELTFDANKIVEKVNKGFDKIGESEYKINLEEIKTTDQYRIKIKDIMQNALHGENKVTLTDVILAERVKLQMEKREDTKEYDE